MIKPNSPVHAASDWPDAYPNSTRAWIEGPDGVRVPVREIALAGGEAPLRVYDPSGPLEVDVHSGLAPVRASWLLQRGDTEVFGERRGDNINLSQSRGDAEIPEALRRTALRAKSGMRVTQMHYARRGEITREMEFVALREGLPAEFVRAEVARGRAIIPANINHPEVEPIDPFRRRRS